MEAVSDIQKAGTSAFDAGAGGGAKGTAVLDFGAYPGKSDVSVNVTGQTGIVAGSVVNAWIRPVATADHSADEHLLETLKVVAGNIISGIGFTIYGFNANQINEPLEKPKTQMLRQNVIVAQQPAGSDPAPSVGGMGTRLYGQFAVAWVWS